MRHIYLIILLILTLIISGCSPDAKVSDFFPPASNDTKTQVPVNTPNLNSNISEVTPNLPSGQMITLLSWNIQNLGQKKANNEFIMKSIANKINLYDIAVIQELSNVNELVDVSCDRNVNSKSNANYNLIQTKLQPWLLEGYRFAISPQIDDERYMFVYNANKISLKGCSVAYDDNSGQLCQKSDKGLMKREPYICDFGVGGASFRVGNVHTSPSNNFNELMGINIIFQQELEKDNDLIFAGDFNMDCDYVSKGNPLLNNGYNFLQFLDTTVYDGTSCGYDVFMYKNLTQIHILKAGLDRRDVNGEISDHYPIYVQIGIN